MTRRSQARSIFMGDYAGTAEYSVMGRIGSVLSKPSKSGFKKLGKSIGTGVRANTFRAKNAFSTAKPKIASGVKAAGSFVKKNPLKAAAIAGGGYAAYRGVKAGLRAVGIGRPKSRMQRMRESFGRRF
ncbi:MAG TPA: hypothetical protein V6C65_04300 [Allocoleopsis sp.]